MVNLLEACSVSVIFATEWEVTCTEMDVHKRLSTLSERMKREIDGGAAPNPEALTVREFLSWFGYSRRGRNNVRRIRHKLSELDLRTVPDFEVTWIDGKISIALDPEAVEGITARDEPIDPTIRIGAIEAANHKPTTVDPNSPLSVATTLMHTNDFSQLPVMQNEHEVKGIISWKSIGIRLSLGHDCQWVRECMTLSPPEVSIEDPLFSAIGYISQHDYVLVRGQCRKITGIVTSSDVAGQFVQLAGPFLRIGEIEGYLRSLIHRKFTVDELNQALPPSSGDRTVSGPEDLTIGEYHQLLGKEELWNRLNLNLDRKEFRKQLDWVRERRNDVMHFAPDGLEPQDLKKLHSIAMFFRDLRRMEIV